MAESDPSFAEASRELMNWTESLRGEVEGSLAKIQEILGKSTGRTSAICRQRALLVFRGVKEKLSEVDFAVKMVDRAIRNAGKKRESED